MPNNKYAPTTWGQRQDVDLTCPSGQMCRVIRPGVEGLIQLGLLNKLDSLTGLVDQKHIQRVKGGKKAPELDINSLIRDPKSLSDALSTMDKVVVHVVQEPALTLDPEEKDKIHIGSVDMDDRAFIFQFATGGTGDLEAFRKQREQLTRSVESKQAIQNKAK